MLSILVMVTTLMVFIFGILAWIPMVALGPLYNLEFSLPFRQSSPTWALVTVRYSPVVEPASILVVLAKGVLYTRPTQVRTSHWWDVFRLSPAVSNLHHLSASRSLPRFRTWKTWPHSFNIENLFRGRRKGNYYTARSSVHNYYVSLRSFQRIFTSSTYSFVWRTFVVI